MTTPEIPTMLSRATLRRHDWGRWRRPVMLGTSILGVAVAAYVFARGGWGFDFFAYWSAEPLHPYQTVEGFGAFHYPPPVAWFGPALRLLPFEASFVLWTALNLAALAWMARRWTLAWLAFLPVSSELFHGNVHLLMAAALVLGLRSSPWAWALIAVKLSTLVVLLDWVLRRQWRRLLACLLPLGVVVVVSLVLQPGDWIDWVTHLLERSSGQHDTGAQILIPPWLRLPIATALVVAAAWRGLPWLLAPAMVLAMPILWWHSLAALVAIQPLAGRPDGHDSPSTTPGRSR